MGTRDDNSTNIFLLVAIARLIDSCGSLRNGPADLLTAKQECFLTGSRHKYHIIIPSLPITDDGWLKSRLQPYCTFRSGSTS